MNVLDLNEEYTTHKYNIGEERDNIWVDFKVNH